MKTATRRALAALMLCNAVSVWSQTSTVMVVSQALPFASSGTVSTTDGKEKPILPKVPDKGTNSTQTQTAAAMAQAGGRISTGTDGATSLILGGTGTGRMGADSEVSVPDAAEKGSSLEMLKGRLFLNISADELKQRAAGEFRLKTPAALLAVKGTKFFAIIQEGADIVGVHEGEVMVSTADRKISLTLHAGEAAVIKGGQISPLRVLTDGEKAYASEYPPALTQMKVAVVAPGQRPPPDTGALLSWSVFKAYDVRHLTSFGTTNAPDPAVSGVIRYRFSKPTPQAELFHGIGNLTLKGKAKALNQAPPMALLLKVAPQGLASITLAWGGSSERMQYMRQDTRNAASVRLTDATPSYVLVPVPAPTEWRSTGDLRLNVDFDLIAAAARLEKQEFKVEMSEFRFLRLPP
jgi:FecR-like protein